MVNASHNSTSRLPCLNGPQTTQLQKAEPGVISKALSIAPLAAVLAASFDHPQSWQAWLPAAAFLLLLELSAPQLPSGPCCPQCVRLERC